MGKVIKLILLLTISTSSFSQNKTIIPKNGIIVFKSNEEIYDTKLYQASKKDFFNSITLRLISSVKKEREEKGIPTDSIELKELTANGMLDEMFSDAFTNKDTKYYLDYQDSIVNKGEVVKDFETLSLYINCKTRKFESGFIEGIYEFSNNKILGIKVDRKSSKIINGFKCFKVFYSYKDIPNNKDHDDFKKFMEEYTITREMWVTKFIQSDFHPLINDEIILKEYYPLEIIETSDMIKGVKTIYSLEKFNLN